MNDDPSRRRLGRGLAALIGDIDRPGAPPEKAAAPDGKIPIEAIAPNPRNPRRHFAEAELADLAQSIREHGIVQPVVVRPGALQGKFEIVAGERRWRAAQLAGLDHVPVIVRDVDDRVALELAIIENVQRADLNPVEEAAGYQQLIEEHNYTQADLAGIIGKSRSHVANTLRLLKLPPAVHSMLHDGSLSAGHARTLVTASNPEALARRIVAQGLSVRQAEAAAQDAQRPRSTASGEGKDPDAVALEKLLSDITGMRVTVTAQGGGGELRIRYRTLEQLDEICRRLQS